MTLRSLQKWHGAGNDFLVDVLEPGESTWWNAQRAQRVCHRALGVGADGLLVAVLDEPVTMILYNADGSVAEMSGNGIRCLAAAVRRTTKADWDELEVATDAGVRVVSLTMNGDDGYGSVAMGEVTFEATVPGSLGVANVGNPHVVVLHREGLVGVEVTIENPGGDLMVRLDEDGARLAGPVQFVANVEWLQA